MFTSFYNSIMLIILGQIYDCQSNLYCSPFILQGSKHKLGKKDNNKQFPHCYLSLPSLFSLLPSPHPSTYSSLCFVFRDWRDTLVFKIFQVIPNEEGVISYAKSSSLCNTNLIMHSSHSAL